MVGGNVGSTGISAIKRVFRFINTNFADRIRFWGNIYSWKDNTTYKNSNWYKFQEAVKEHQKESWEILSDSSFKELEIENW